MKQLLTILALLTTVFIEAHSQDTLQQFTAKEGLATAIQTAKDSEIENPQLTFVGTANQVIQLGVVQVEVKFDINTGKSTSWVYVFYDAKSNDFYGWIVFNSKLGGYNTLPFDPDQLVEEGINLNKDYTLEGIEWFDSDSTASRYRNNLEFYNFYMKKQDPDQFYAAVFNNSFIQALDIGEAYWALSVTNDNNVETCSWEMSTDYMLCGSEVLAVAERNLLTDDINVQPNPASEYITLTGIKDLSGSARIVIYSVNGTLMLENDNFTGNNLDISNFPIGMYYIKIENAGKVTVKQLSVVK